MPGCNTQALKTMSSHSASNESILLSLKVMKINWKGKAQQRAILITSRKIFNLMPDNFSKCNRCIKLAQLHHLSVSPGAQVPRRLRRAPPHTRVLFVVQSR